MTDNQVLEAIFELDNDAPAREIANEIGAPVTDVITRLENLEKQGAVDQVGTAFELTETGMDLLEQITA